MPGPDNKNRSWRDVAALRIAAALALGLTLSACQFPTTAAYQEQVSSWVGRPVDQLFLSWGPPQRSQTLTDGGRVIEYDRQELRYAPGMSFPERYPAYVARDPTGRRHVVYRTVWRETPGYVTEQRCVTRFHVSKDGAVQSMTFAGNACVAYPTQPTAPAAPPPPRSDQPS
jgi:hypothetical protein